MAGQFVGKSWKKEELQRYVSDVAAVAGAVPFVYSEGKAEGVRGVHVYTGSGLTFTSVPGRAMDIYDCRYKGIPLQFTSATGMTSPGYYEEPGIKWLRTFFGGLLATCGITYSGGPCVDQGEPLGLHGRIGNAAAENICINDAWSGDEYIITLSGRMREASVMGENLTLTRVITTKLGSKAITIRDTVENRGFEPQPFMMLYHFNFGFPLLSPTANIVGPIQSTVPRDEQAAADNGVAECRGFSSPQDNYGEKVFFHSLAADSQGKTFVALVNRDVGGDPLGMALSFKKEELPELTQWKMMRKGCYVCGIEPGTVTPIGRAAWREKEKLPMIEALETKTIEIEFEVLDSMQAIEAVEKKAKELV